MFIFLALIFYITVVTGSLFLSIFSKKINGFFLKVLFVLHASFLIMVVTNLILKNSGHNLPVVFHLSFLFYCCSGILIFGMVLKYTKKIILKIYFGLFMLSFPVFLIKPSALINFLLYMEIKSNKKDSFVINDKFQLEKHQTIKNNSTTNIPYKLVSVHGPFHKTIKRNIMFDKPLDSLKTLFFLFPDSISIRGYSLNETNQYDSTDITIYLTKK